MTATESYDALTAQYTDLDFTCHTDTDPLTDDTVLQVAGTREDGLEMTWLIFGDGETCHLNTRFIYGSPGWEPHPDDMH